MRGPKVRLGTKWLSITSQWTQSRAGSTIASASARRVKSAERMLGAAIGGVSGTGGRAARPVLVARAAVAPRALARARRAALIE